ncbi:hypothetical protein [Jiangella endophytica]|uniref:hypothetical protein n=1 Tax=Jiangella endophytica TaxID=1623398 RepID=UPI000E34E455|nr:hypothetical protein [Jiangella endophytica]
MTDTNHAWVWIGYVTTTDGEVTGAFVIDERRYPDAGAAQAALNAAAEELRRRGIPHELQHVRIRRDAPAEPLPTWAEYRATLPAGDA